MPIFYTTDIFEFPEYPSVPPLYEIEVTNSDISVYIPILEKGPFEPYNLQSMIMHRFTSSTEVKQEERKAGALVQFLANYDVFLDPKTKVDLRKFQRINFLYAPSTFALRIQRSVFLTALLQIKTTQRVKFPSDFIIKIPTILYPSINYKIFAIICHTGDKPDEGHYLLYFNYSKNEKWYYYNNDVPKKLTLREKGLFDTDIKKIETLGTVFWVTRIEK